jgi:hypothetical protein
MDTRIPKTKQGAGNPVDLSQQEPHEEDIEQKPSAVSSDEERLAADISMTGLQAKRLSGAQRKKLTREGKMKEGTWTEKKPPSKTPSPQDKAALGGRGGVKRPHSESSTPSQEIQQTKTPRNTEVQTGTYKEVVTGIKMAIVHR